MEAKDRALPFASPEFVLRRDSERRAPQPCFSQQFPCYLGPLSIPVCYMQLTEGLTVTLKNLRKRKAGFESMPAARPGPFYLPEPVPA